MLLRRTVVKTPLLLAAAAAQNMTFSMHQFTSAGAGYRKSLEGWARAGVRHVEPSANLLDEYLKTETLASAKRVITDNGLQVVCGAVGTTGLWEPNAKFAENLEVFRKRCEQFAELGAPIVYSPCVSSAKFVAEDYVKSPEQIRRVAEVAKGFGLKVAAEFVRSSTFMASLPTALRLHRAAAHPNFGVLFDCYHFWSGPSKMEDLAMIRPGEIIHAHLNDTPEMPRELLDLQSRVGPGEGVAPLKQMLERLPYRGPISVELFWPKYQQADPYEMAKELRGRAAGVLGG